MFQSPWHLVRQWIILRFQSNSQVPIWHKQPNWLSYCNRHCLFVFTQFEFSHDVRYDDCYWAKFDTYFHNWRHEIQPTHSQQKGKSQWKGIWDCPAVHWIHSIPCECKKVELILVSTFTSILRRNISIFRLVADLSSIMNQAFAIIFSWSIGSICSTMVLVQIDLVEWSIYIQSFIRRCLAVWFSVISFPSFIFSQN